MHFDPFQGYCKERVSGWAGLTDQRRGHGRGLVGCSALVTPTGIQVRIDHNDHKYNMLIELPFYYTTRKKKPR